MPPATSAGEAGRSARDGAAVSLDPAGGAPGRGRERHGATLAAGRQRAAAGIGCCRVIGCHLAGRQRRAGCGDRRRARAGPTGPGIAAFGCSSTGVGRRPGRATGSGVAGAGDRRWDGGRRRAGLGNCRVGGLRVASLNVGLTRTPALRQLRYYRRRARFPSPLRAAAIEVL